jgi:hypothetical protein
MTRKPQNLTPTQLSLVKETYRLILNDKVITDEEMVYLKKLYWVVYDVDETNEDVIKQDLAELSGWTIKNVSK